ncbi:MAG: PEP/pyruvate-binding domain-containing protein [Acidimicrobiia bacterium]
MVVRLDDRRALDPALVGAKAANLARGAVAGLRVVPGEVLTTAAPVTFGVASDPDSVVLGDGVREVLDEIWARVTEDGRRPLAVRSSSTVEDLGESSMAGRFTSVIGVGDRDEFVTAVHTVLSSAGRAALADGVAPRPMAVLVQPVVRPVCGGVMFGVDPISGDRRRIVVEVSRQGPEAIVGGAVSGAMATLNRRGGIVEADEQATSLLSRPLRRRLARLASKTAVHFEQPQDVEWAIDDDGSLWLLQTRPVTAVGAAPRVTGPLLGAGPFGETFPLPLRPLERDLWLTPVDDAVRDVLATLGLAANARRRAAPVVTSVDGWVVCDLGLMGLTERRGGWHSLAPLPAFRHVRAAWRVGALRGALPVVARRLGQRTESELSTIGPLGEHDDVQLIALLRRGRAVLVSLHAHQMLSAILLPDEAGPSLAASATLLLRRGRANGLDDAAIIARDPITLGLVPPRIGGLPMPKVVDPGPNVDAAVAREIDQLVTRDALRLWCRLVQELTARVAAELERRLVGTSRLPGACIAHLTLSELEAVVVEGRELPAGLTDRAAAPDAAPVPHAFHLGEGGEVVPLQRTDRGRLGGRGAGGGRAVGVVLHDPDGEIPQGAILVVGSLDPRLAPVIGRLGGLVAETGSVLSHLAILAREQHVATVVGVPDARHRFPPGSELAIDGSTGEVRLTTGKGATS